MGKNYISALIVHAKTDRQLFRRGRRELTAKGQ